jgi:hypothetical protein
MPVNKRSGQSLNQQAYRRRIHSENNRAFQVLVRVESMKPNVRGATDHGVKAIPPYGSAPIWLGFR